MMRISPGVLLLSTLMSLSSFMSLSSLSSLLSLLSLFVPFCPFIARAAFAPNLHSFPGSASSKLRSEPESRLRISAAQAANVGACSAVIAPAARNELAFFANYYKASLDVSYKRTISLLVHLYEDL